MTQKKSKPNLKKLQGTQTRQKLYESARKLFTTRDFDSVSVEDITRTAGVTKGTFYVHFESKDALVAQLIADYASQADTNYKAFLDTLPDDMPTSSVLLALSSNIADMLVNAFGFENMRKIYQMMLAGTAGTDAVKGYGRELYVMFYGILEKGIQNGEFKSSLPLEVLSRHFVMAMRGVSYEWCIRYPDFDLKEQAVEHCKLLIEGIKVK